MQDFEGQRISGAQAIIACLEAKQAQGIFVYPGGQVLDIFDALYSSKELHPLLMRHEQAAAHAADGYARATGKPGIVIVTSGPGATNTVTGIANAYMDSIPMIIITGQVDTTVIGTDAFQESDITGITMPIVKHSYLVKDAKNLPRIMGEAFHIATTGRPGPVLIDVPADIAQTTFEFHYPPADIQMTTYRPTYKGHSRQIIQATGLILKARRPILYVGGGIIASGATDELKQLAELMQIPVITTLMGKGCFPADHHLCFGMSGMHGTKYANMAITGSDLVIAVGVRFADRVTGRLADFAKGAKVIHIDIDPAEIGKSREPEVPIVGDAAQVLRSIVAELQKGDAQPQSIEWVEQVDEWRKRYAPVEKDDPCSITPSMFFAHLARKAAPYDPVFTTEVGQHQMWAARYLPISKPRTFLSSGGLGAMGFGFPAAIGAQRAFPDRTVICIAGDGSFQMNVQEMATARIAGLPVKVIVIDNSSLGMVRQWQQLFYQGRYSASLLADVPDLVKLADAYGWRGSRIDSPDEVDDAIVALLAGEGPALLDVRIPRSELVLPMTRPGGALDDLIMQANAPATYQGRDE